MKNKYKKYTHVQMSILPSSQVALTPTHRVKFNCFLKRENKRVFRADKYLKRVKRLKYCNIYINDRSRVFCPTIHNV